MTELRRAINIWNLKQIATGGKPSLSSLEEEFIEYSLPSDRKGFLVRPPLMHKLAAEQTSRYSLALSSLGLDASGIDEIDITGVVPSLQYNPEFIIISAQQLKADHCVGRRAYLTPLVEKVYSEGAELIRDFSIHEPLIGRVSARIGGIALSDLKKTSSITPGPYTLSLTLDTPELTIKDFIGLYSTLDAIITDPKPSLLDPIQVKSITHRAITLRKRLGSLSRYRNPEGSTFEAETNSVQVSTGYYLYSPENNSNAFIYFGANPMQSVPPGITIIDGDRKDSLPKLMELGFYHASQGVLEERIAAFDRIEEKGSGAMAHNGISYLVDELKKARSYFSQVLNPDMRDRFAIGMEEEILEYFVYPSSEDAVLHQLLPRLSYSKAIKRYHDPDNFVREFEAEDDHTRIRVLSEISSQIIFNNMQNLDTNIWLYRNHHEFCEANGFSFDVVQS
jgi:hypothetical protein